MLRIATIPLLMGALGASGCGYVVSGAHTEVPVKSDPSGATVVVDGVTVGRTPLRVSLRASERHTIEVRAPGFVARSYVLEPRVEVAYVVFDAIILVGLIIDPLTGGWYDLRPYAVDAELPDAPGAARPASSDPDAESGDALDAPPAS